MGQPISAWRRWRIHRDVEDRFGLIARRQVQNLGDSGLAYYTNYVLDCFGHVESLRLATIAERIGDDATNYPEYLNEPNS